MFLFVASIVSQILLVPGTGTPSNALVHDGLPLTENGIYLTYTE